MSNNKCKILLDNSDTIIICYAPDFIVIQYKKVPLGKDKTTFEPIARFIIKTKTQ